MFRPPRTRPCANPPPPQPRRFGSTRSSPHGAACRPPYAETAEGLASRRQKRARERGRLLPRKELLVVERGRARGLRVVADATAPETARSLAAADGGARGAGLPVIGEVAAGQ